MYIKRVDIFSFLLLLLPSFASNTKFNDVCDLTRNQMQDFAETLGNHESTITRLSGAKVGDKLNSLTCGRNGPVLLQDTLLLEELRQFDSERVPERVVHAKGGGAFGTFTVTSSEITKYTRASVFNEVGKKTPAFVRFSTAFSETGSADTERGTRGMAVKLYTDGGIFDFLGLNVPVASVRDAHRFPSLIRSRKRNPKTHLLDASALWDFVSLNPEAVHQVMYFFGELGIPDGFRFMDAFSVNTFKLVNSENVAVYCRFQYTSNQGIKTLNSETAQRLAGEDADYSIRDLYNAIERGDFPSWKFHVQVMTFEEAANWYFNPFDTTKVWPEREFPLIEVGELVFNRNPDNYFAQVEQSAFSPTNLPDGIEASPDIELHGRFFSYPDTQKHRLGTNFQKIPINRPHFNTQTPTLRDGDYVFDNNMNGAPSYYPNSFSNAKTNSRFNEHRFRSTSVPDVDRYNSGLEDNYSQPRMFWEERTEREKQILMQNIATHLRNAQMFIKKRTVAVLSKVHKDFGTGVWRVMQVMNTTNCL